jgi:hypothetical protein
VESKNRFLHTGLVAEAKLIFLKAGAILVCTKNIVAGQKKIQKEFVSTETKTAGRWQSVALGAVSPQSS